MDVTPPGTVNAPARPAGYLINFVFPFVNKMPPWDSYALLLDGTSMLSSPDIPENVLPERFLTLPGIDIAAKSSLHPVKMLPPSDCTPSLSLILLRFLQYANAHSSISRTLPGIVMLSNAQLANA